MQFVFARMVHQVLYAAFKGQHWCTLMPVVKRFASAGSGAPNGVTNGHADRRPTDKSRRSHCCSRTGLMTCEGAGRVSGSQSKLEVSHSGTCIVVYIITCNH